MRGILIFYYVGGAGGKFIANCLTYSQQVAFTNYDIALRGNPVEYNQELLKTIPDRANSRTWLELEHGCGQLFGSAASTIKQSGTVVKPATLNDLDLLQDQWLPIMAHFRSEVDNIQRYFKDVPQRLIIVDARPEFIDLAIRLKWANPDHCLDLGRYREFKEDIATLTPDYTFANWDPRSAGAIASIQKFAQQILDIDLDLTAAQDYIDRYLAFHS